MNKNRKRIGMVATSLALSFGFSQEAQASNQESLVIVEETRNQLLSLVYALQPKVEEVMPTLDTEFSDVPEGAWYEDGAYYVVAWQIMSGTSETTFSPEMPVTRGIVATVITNAQRADLGTYPNVFYDATYQWYRDSANWCSVHHIMDGYSKGFFGGNDPVTREQLAQILYSFARFRYQDTSTAVSLSVYDDGKNVSDYARTALAWCIAENILFSDNGMLKPQYPATRAEVAVAIMNFLEN